MTRSKPNKPEAETTADATEVIPTVTDTVQESEVPSDETLTESPVLIKPTVGRQVWFNCGENQPNAATIIYVHDDHTVNIDICDMHGNHTRGTKITLIHDGECPVGCVEWMPYQKEQAKK